VKLEIRISHNEFTSSTSDFQILSPADSPLFSSRVRRLLKRLPSLQQLLFSLIVVSLENFFIAFCPRAYGRVVDVKVSIHVKIRCVGGEAADLERCEPLLRAQNPRRCFRLLFN